MNPKIFVGVAVGGMVVFLLIFALPGISIISDIGEEGFLSPQDQTVLPIIIELFNFSIIEIDEGNIRIRF